MKKRCPNCLEVINSKKECPFCGYKFNTEDEDALKKYGSTVKSDKYYLGKVFCKEKIATSYFGYDLASDIKVIVTELESEAALEILCSQSGLDITLESLGKRFLNYGVAMAGVGSCGIFQRIIDTFEENGAYYIVWEYFNGRSLREISESNIVISHGNVLKFVDDICKGLKILHNSHMVFGALSPDTIYFTPNGDVKIFGIGSPFFDFITSKEIKRKYLSPAFAAPEIFLKGMPKGAYSDIYSIASVMYFVLTEKTPPASFERCRVDTVVSPKKYNSEIEKNMAVAILNGINWSIECRTRNTDSLLQSLKAKRVKRKTSFPTAFSYFIGRLQIFAEQLKRIFARIKHESSDRLSSERNGGKRSFYKIYFIALAVIAAGLLCFLPFLLKRNANKNATSSLWHYGTNSGSTDSEESNNFVYEFKKQPSTSTASFSNELAQNQSYCPDIVGVDVNAAEVLLLEANLKLGKITYKESDSTEGIVLSQSVPKGVRVEHGKPVNVVVSKKSESSKPKDVLNVIGITVEEAKEKLLAAGYKNIKVEYTGSGENPGTVIAAVCEDETITPESEIVLTVEGESVKTPKLIGISLKDAILAGSDFKITAVDKKGTNIKIDSEDISGYNVIKQSIHPGTVTYKGAKIILTVSKKQG